MKPDSTTVFSFPMKSPSGAITRTEMTAIEQLDYWLLFQRHWCEHKPSVTISVKEHEWMELVHGYMITLMRYQVYPFTF